MKNLALIAIAVLGVSAAFAQTEPTKPKVDTKAQPLKTEKGIARKKGTPAKKETPAPAISKKAN